MTETKLPDTPSALIRHVLQDVRAVEKDPLYRVDMGSWHRKLTHVDFCKVCMGGAAMVGLGVPQNLNASPMTDYLGVAYELSVDCSPYEKVSKEDIAKIYLCDDLRLGKLDTGSLNFRTAFPELPLMLDEFNSRVRDYHENSEKWHFDMLKFAYLLEENGL